MVSKVVKKTPTKSLKNRRNLPHHHHHRRKKTPVKNASTTASLVVASINKSIYTCHRRLIKIFSKLARIATPKKTPRKKGYQVLEKVPANPPESGGVKRSLFNDSIALPPLPSPDKKTIFLDLDETLIHSKANPPPEKYDFVVRPVIDGEKVEFYVLKRPFVDEFLEFLSRRFEIVVFTAGIKEYASLVVDKLDWRKRISHRLYRDSCKKTDGKYVKDLSEVGRELKNVVIVDDNPNSYVYQPDNAIPIKPFTDDLGDTELKSLIQFFEGFESLEDTRDAVKKYVADHKVEDVGAI